MTDLSRRDVYQQIGVTDGLVSLGIHVGRSVDHDRCQQHLQEQRREATVDCGCTWDVGRCSRRSKEPHRLSRLNVYSSNTQRDHRCKSNHCQPTHSQRILCSSLAYDKIISVRINSSLSHYSLSCSSVSPSFFVSVYMSLSLTLGITAFIRHCPEAKY